MEPTVVHEERSGDHRRLLGEFVNGLLDCFCGIQRTGLRQRIP